MTEGDSIVFHFLNPELYDKFIQELSAVQFVKLLKKDQDLLNNLFTGCRVNSRNLSLPAVQRRIKEESKKSQILRDFLCHAWLETKKQLVSTLSDFFPYSLNIKATDLEWIGEINELQKKYGHKEMAEKIVKTLFWTEANHDDIRILISVLSIEHEDQKALELYIDKALKIQSEKPESYFGDLVTKIEVDNKSIVRLVKKKQELEEDRSGYKIRLDEFQVTREKDLKEFETKLSELKTKENEAQQKVEKLKKDLTKIEKDLGDILSEKSQFRKKYRKGQKKTDYEQKKIGEEINLIDEAINDVDKTKAEIEASINKKVAIKDKLEQEILSQKQMLRKQTLKKKGLDKERTVIDHKEVEASIHKVREDLTRIKKILGQLEPLRVSDKGFVATPSTLDIIERLSNDNFEPPIELPKRPENINDIDGHVSYWAYQAVWSSEKWNEAAIIQYTFWRSRQLQNEDAKIAAELALSGIYHAERGLGTEQDKLLLIQFVEVIGGFGSNYQKQDDYDETIGKLLEKMLENWERKSLLPAFLGQLSLVSPEKLAYMFDIVDTRTRILLKRVLARSFEGILDIDEFDPSHDITHIITSSLEQKEAQLRSASNRWLVQDSVDAIAQNARHNLMASIAQFPDVGLKKTDLFADEFESQVSAPLSKAIRSGAPQAFEQLSLQCYAYSNEIIKNKAWLSSVYLWPCVMHMAGIAMEANIQAKRLFRAALELSTDKQFYPLNVPDRPCSVEIFIKNYGNTEAVDLKALIMSSVDSDDAEIRNGELAFPALKPDNEIRHKIQILLKNDIQACVLEYILNWKDSSSMDERSQTGILKLLSQREVNWDQVQNPYSLKSIKDPSRLKGRSDVMNTLRRSLDSMDSYYITGQRRTGKSSVAQVYYNELNSKSNHAAVYLWWGELGTTELTLICYAICYELAQKLRERTRKDDIFCPSISEFSGNENFVFTTFFRQLHSRFLDWKIFIIIDDFDELPSSFHETKDGDRFFLLLRALLDQEFVALYLVGSEKLPQILRRQGERLNLNQRCEIDYLKDPNEIEKIIIYPAKGILEYDKESIDNIKILSAGNPYYATLICSRLFNDMARLKDYFVSKRDVERSIESMIEEDSLSTYQHFWKDGVFLPGRLGERQQYHNAKVLIATSRAQTAESGSVSKEELLMRDDLNPLGKEDAEYALNGLLDRKVIVAEDGRLAVRVPIFSQWLSGSGARAVEHSFAEAGLDEVPITITRGLSTRELIHIAQDLVYQEKEINEILIADWLSQFGGTSNQILAFKLLRRFREEGYYNQARMFSAFKELHKQIVSIEASESDFAPRTERKSIVNVVVSYLDPSGKSGHACQYAYRKVNRIHSKCGVAPDKLVDFFIKTKEKPPIIFADDIVGTGETISKGFKNLEAEMVNRGLNVSDYKLYLAAMVGTRIGYETVEKATEGAMQIMLWSDINDRLQAFSEKAEIFTEETDRQASKEMIEEIGKELEPKHPLGRNNGQLLVAFQHGCPNNTLPIFYKSGRTFRGREWRPLFPR